MTWAAKGASAFFCVTRVGIFGATSRSVHKGQLKYMQCMLWLHVRGGDAESRMVSIREFEFAAQQCHTIRQSLATASVAVRFDALKEQEAHRASMGSLVKFREGSGASMVEDSVAACPGLAGFVCVAACAVGTSQLRGRLGPEHGVGHPSSGVGPCQCQEVELVDVLGGEWREATSFCCRKSDLLWVTSGALSLRRA